MYVTQVEREALQLMAVTGGWWSANEWRAMGMVAAGLKAQILCSLGLVERKRANPVLYRISAEGRDWLHNEQEQT